MGYRIGYLIEVCHNNPGGGGDVRSNEEVIIKLGTQVRDEIILVATISDPEGGHVRDTEVMGDHHHQDVPPHGPRHLLRAEPGLRGHVEVVSCPASAALIILDLETRI